MAKKLMEIFPEHFPDIDSPEKLTARAHDVRAFVKEHSPQKELHNPDRRQKRISENYMTLMKLLRGQFEQITVQTTQKTDKTPAEELVERVQNAVQTPKRRGRPKGSKTKPPVEPPVEPQQTDSRKNPPRAVKKKHDYSEKFDVERIIKVTCQVKWENCSKPTQQNLDDVWETVAFSDFLRKKYNVELRDISDGESDGESGGDSGGESDGKLQEKSDAGLIRTLGSTGDISEAAKILREARILKPPAGQTKPPAGQTKPPAGQTAQQQLPSNIVCFSYSV